MRTRYLSRLRVMAVVVSAILGTTGTTRAQEILGGALPSLFPSDNWWNTDISSAPIDTGSKGFIGYVNNGGTRHLHPDFGGDADPPAPDTYGFSYCTVPGSQPKLTVAFDIPDADDSYPDQSDGVNHSTGESIPFYPVPAAAISEDKWIEGGYPGTCNPDTDDSPCSGDRHFLIVDRDNRNLYELYHVYYDGSQWHASSGAFFDLKSNSRRPDGWTSADAAGLAVLPGLVRYDEAFGSGAITHSFRVTVRHSNGSVYPASHDAGDTPHALPMGARLRLKASKDISGFTPEVQRIFQAFKTYGLIVADNGSDMYVSGTYDTRWDNDVLNPAFGSLSAGDFDVIQLGWKPGATPPPPPPPPPLSGRRNVIPVGLSGDLETNGRP